MNSKKLGTAILLLFACAVLCSCRETQYRYVTPEVRITLKGIDPERVFVEKWYQAESGDNVFGMSKVAATKYIETDGEPPIIRLLERSVSTTSKQPIILVIRLETPNESRKIEVPAEDFGDGSPKPVERTVSFGVEG